MEVSLESDLRLAIAAPSIDAPIFAEHQLITSVDPGVTDHPTTLQRIFCPDEFSQQEPAPVLNKPKSSTSKRADDCHSIITILTRSIG